jgi:hypothetical protein
MWGGEKMKVEFPEEPQSATCVNQHGGLSSGIVSFDHRNKENIKQMVSMALRKHPSNNIGSQLNNQSSTKSLRGNSNSRININSENLQ